MVNIWLIWTHSWFTHEELLGKFFISSSSFFIVVWAPCLHFRRWYRSSHPRCSIKKAVFKIFAIFTGKQLCWSLFLIICSVPATLLKRDSNTGVFLWILQKFLGAPFFIEHLRTTVSDSRVSVQRIKWFCTKKFLGVWRGATPLIYFLIV